MATGTTPGDSPAAVRNRRVREVRDHAVVAFARHEFRLLYSTAVTTGCVTGDHQMYRCQAPGTWIHGFDVRVSPGFLCVTGDMGTMVVHVNDPRPLAWVAEVTDLGYFAEKVAREIETEEFDPDVARAWATELDALIREGEYGPGSRQAASWPAARAEFLSLVDSGYEACVNLLVDHGLVDLGDPPDMSNWKYRYLWTREAAAWLARHLYPKKKDAPKTP